MPITPFKGVRISWLILATNSLLARLAASAASLTCRNASWARFRPLYSHDLALFLDQAGTDFDRNPATVLGDQFYFIGGTRMALKFQVHHLSGPLE